MNRASLGLYFLMTPVHLYSSSDKRLPIVLQNYKLIKFNFTLLPMPLFFFSYSLVTGRGLIFRKEQRAYQTITCVHLQSLSVTCGYQQFFRIINS